jgi:hypothetical protein
MTRRNSILALVAFLMAACGMTTPVNTPSAPLTPTPAAVPTSDDPGRLTARSTPNPASAPAYLAPRLAALAEAIKRPIPILTLTNGLTEQQRIAQEMAIRDDRFRRYAFDDAGRPLRNEVFQIYPARESDITEQTAACRTSTCYRVEMYNFAYNLTTLAIVDVQQPGALAVGVQAQMQPDIPEALKQLAVQIAVNAPEVQEALGYKPTEAEALMASTKTALNRTRCERSRHLCVAPTFVKDDRALWAIVDLTEHTLVGVRWTHVGKTGLAVTERKLQDINLSEAYCEKEIPVERAGWALNYILTTSDGLRVSGVKFNGREVVRSAKMVDWHVSYSNTDGFGYSDAIGCPYFSQAAVIAIEPPTIVDLPGGGFAIEQRFQSEGWPTPCNYNYRQRYEFYPDGSWRPMVASVGRGCGNDGTYRPVTRVAFPGQANTFAQWSGGDWKAWEAEQWHLQQRDTAYSPEGWLYRLADATGSGFYVEPNRGQFNDGSRGDFAWTYVTRNDAGRDEGESDLITVGPCCNTDHRQGPEKFIEPSAEPIKDTALVLWYVSQMKNDDRPGSKYCWADSVLVDGVFAAQEYPCYTGPMFVPIP